MCIILHVTHPSIIKATKNRKRPERTERKVNLIPIQGSDSRNRIAPQTCSLRGLKFQKFSGGGPPDSPLWYIVQYPLCPNPWFHPLLRNFLKETCWQPGYTSCIVDKCRGTHAYTVSWFTFQGASKQVTQSNFKVVGTHTTWCLHGNCIDLQPPGSLWNSDELVYLPHKMDYLIYEVDSWYYTTMFQIERWPIVKQITHKLAFHSTPCAFPLWPLIRWTE